MKQDSTFNRWYEKNKDEYNRQRRERYAKDKEYRTRQNAYRARKPPKMIIPPGYIGITEAAKELGRTSAAIKRWERNGYIPSAKWVSNRRFYTQHQVNLMQGIAELTGKYPGSSAVLADELEKLVPEIINNWEY